MKQLFYPRKHDGDHAHEPNQCAFMLCLPELHFALASPGLDGVYPAGAAFFWPFA